MLLKYITCSILQYVVMIRSEYTLYTSTPEYRNEYTNEYAKECSLSFLLKQLH